MFDTNPEYLVIYHWDQEHWSAITTGDIPVDIYQYIKNNLAEMQDAMEVSEDAYFSIEYRYGTELISIWQGTPEELLKTSKEIADEWLSHAFE
jgi:hypothetical protein